MHVVLVADFHPERLGASWARAFVANGVKLSEFDVREHNAKLGFILRNRITHRLTINNYAIRSRSARAYNQAIVDFAIGRKPDLVVFHNGDFVFPDTIRKLQSDGIRCVLYHADNPFPPHYANRPETLPVARLMDKYFVWSEKLALELQEAGVSNAAFLPFAWDEKVFPYQEQDGKIWPGVLFVGGWDEEREAFLDEIAKHYPLKIYGPSYWGERTRAGSLSKKCWMGSDLRGAEAAKMIRESAVCLNILRNQHVIKGEPDGLIMRHFEVPGAGGFLLSTRSGGATRLFPEADTAEYFADTAECLEKIKQYLADAGKRSGIVQRAHASVAMHHRYEDRIREVMAALD